MRHKSIPRKGAPAPTQPAEIQGVAVRPLFRAAVAFCLVAAGTVIACGAECPKPAYKYLRSDEDYSYLRNRECRTDPLDVLKYIPLNRDGQVFLSLGGEVRENVEYFHNARWGVGPQGPGYLLERYLFHADLRFGPRFRIFAQVKSGLEEGRAGGPRPIDEDKLDLGQAFVEFKLGAETRPVTVRAGRQELALGSRRLISAREGPTVRQSFDGVQVMFQAARWNLDMLATRPTETRFDLFDDWPAPGQTLWGVYATRAIPRWPGANVDVYYLGFDRSRSRFQRGVGEELRHSLGVRGWGKKGPWDYDVEPILQFGSFQHDGILAWAFESESGYTVNHAWMSPRVALRLESASGDSGVEGGALGTFNPLFPRGLYHQLVDLNGHVNFMSVDPVAVIHPGEKWSLTTDWGFFWRQNRADGLYGVGGQLLRPGGVNDPGYLGSQPSAVLEWRPQRHFTGVLIYTHYFPGGFLRDTGNARPVNYVSGWLSFKF